MVEQPYYPRDLPQWLLLGLKMHELRLRDDAKAWEEAATESGVKNRKLVLYARIANFLQKHYPEALKSGSHFVAGYAVMLELMKLHELSEVHASLESDKTFHGHRSVRELRSLVGTYRHEMASLNAAPAQSSKQRSVTSVKDMVEKVKANPGKLKLKRLDNLETTNVRSPLVPKLIAHCGDKQVAIDIRAPDIKTARTSTTAAVTYLSRISVLLLRFDAVILLMPESTHAYAIAIFELLMEWSKDPVSLLDKVDIMLVDGDQITYVEKPT